MGDDASLRELFLILIDNAVKYTLKKGTITLRLSKVSEWAVVEIADTGVGIATDDLPLL